MKDDSTFKNWPKDLIRAYSELPLPSLYEFVLANERLAAEMRRQGKDIHKIVHSLVSLKDQIQGLDNKFDFEVLELESFEDPSLLSDEDEEGDEEIDEELGDEEDSIFEPNYLERDEESLSGFYPAWEVDMMRQANKLEQRQWEEVYLAMLEILLQLLNDSKKAHLQSIEAIEEASKSAPIKTVKSILDNHEEKIWSIREQMLAHLKDLQLEPIIPLPGEAFDEDIHRVIETIPSENEDQEPNTVARMIRIGYSRRGELVRPADISVYAP